MTLILGLYTMNVFAQLSSATNMTDPVAADEFWILDQSDSGALKAITYEELFKSVPELQTDTIVSDSANTDIAISGNGTGEIDLNDATNISGVLKVDNILSLSTDTDLTLSGNGDGVVGVNDSLFVAGDTTMLDELAVYAGVTFASITSDPVTITSGKIQGGLDAPVAPVEGEDLSIFQIVGFDGGDMVAPARILTQVANGGCGVGAGDIATNMILQVSADGSNVPNGAAITLSGCADSISLDSSGGAEVKVDGTSDLIELTAADVTLSGDLNLPSGEVVSGTYTPTITNVTNIAVSVARECSYMRIGAVVDVACSVNLDAASTGEYQYDFSLPVASNFVAIYDATGTGHGLAGNDDTNYCIADVTNDRVSCYGDDNDASAHEHKVLFQYKVK